MMAGAMLLPTRKTTHRSISFYWFFLNFVGGLCPPKPPLLVGGKPPKPPKLRIGFIIRIGKLEK